MHQDDLNRISHQINVISELLNDAKVVSRLSHPSTLDAQILLRYYSAILVDFCQELSRDTSTDEEFWQIVLANTNDPEW
jgi:hypothetical protein